MESPEFFAVEAGEYLDQLRILASRAEPSAVEQFADLCRSLRGSSLMANQEAIGRSAAALERLALAVSEGRLPWNHHTRGVACRTVDDILGLVAKMGDWSAGENALTEAIVAELDALTGRSSPTAETVRDPEPVPFVSRQGAALAGALQDLIHAHETARPTDRSLDKARELIRSLTGLATLSEVPPLAELLQGIGQVLEGEVQPNRIGADAIPVLRAGAEALAIAMSELAETGAADADSEEVQHFARTLRSFVDMEAEVVPIESLLYDDDESFATESRAATAAPDDLDNLELVSLGERLTLQADEIQSAQSVSQRDFRTNALRQTLNGISGVTRGPMQIALSDFGEAVVDAVQRGMVTNETETFAQHLRDAAETLMAPTSEEQLATRLFDLAADFRALAERDKPADRESAAPDVLEPIARDLGIDTLEDVLHLATSWTRYEELMSDEDTDATVDEPVAMAPDTQPESETSPNENPNDDAVTPIAALCYRGRDAQLRALTLRQEILSSISDPTADRSRIAELVEEVFDLVQLGLDEDA